MRVAGALIDLAGFLGGLGLAIPFFLGEPRRVRLLLALWQRVRAPEHTHPDFDPLIEDDAAHLSNHWPWEVWFARWGAALIAAAFLAKVAISPFER